MASVEQPVQHVAFGPLPVLCESRVGSDTAWEASTGEDVKWQGDEEFDAWSSKPPSGGNPDDAVHVLEQLIAFLEQGPQAAPAGGAHVVEGQHLSIPEVTPAFQGVGKTA